MKFYWLDVIFDHKSLDNYKSVSVASNFWQQGFVNALLQLDCEITLFGYPEERIWPLGRLLPARVNTSVPAGMESIISSYINFPVFRRVHQYLLMKKAVERVIKEGGVPDYTVSYSCLDHKDDKSPGNEVARYLRNSHGVPWICIVADGAIPEGADRYIHLAWSNYVSMENSSTSLHIDGGVPEIAHIEDNLKDNTGPRVFMYMGDLGDHGGITNLARAFTLLQKKNIELWICGRGENRVLEEIIKRDSRITLHGFLEEDVLNSLAIRADFFVNPRPSSFTPNQYNYPSKLLHYLAYGKPVISTLTEGLSPEYEFLFITPSGEDPQSLADAIMQAAQLPSAQYANLCRKCSTFREKHTWLEQASRMLSWLEHAKPAKFQGLSE